MSRKSGPSRRYADGGALAVFIPKSRPTPALLGFIVGVALFCIVYFYRISGGLGVTIESFSNFEGDYSCMREVQQAIPVLKKTYGDSMHKVLHIGPDTCSVVSKLLKEEETESWGIEPYDVEDADAHCKRLVHKGIVRVADIRFPLPYRPKSFALVIVSDSLDYLTPRYLNKTIPDLARVSSDGLVIFAGNPVRQRAKAVEVSKFGRAAKLRSTSWWVRFFVQNNLEENEVAIKKFEQAAKKKGYQPNCRIFHLKSFSWRYWQAFLLGVERCYVIV